MLQGIEAVTLSRLANGLDAATSRQEVTATNIANANTVGYVARRADFAAHMVEARSLLRERGIPDAMLVAEAQLSPVVVSEMRDADGQPVAVQLDVEVAEMARNSLQYQALLKGLSRHFEIFSSAVSDGKR